MASKFRKFTVICKEMLKGKSLGRTLTNLECAKVTLTGRGLDIGARTSKSSYYRFFKISPNTEIVFADVDPEEPSVVKMNLESPLPLQSDSQDFVLLMNCIYLVFNFQEAIEELHRVLREGGLLVGVVPFYFPVTDEPCDYFRFSAAAIRRILEDAKFTQIRITPLGFGPVSTSIAQILHLFKFKSLKLVITLATIAVDRMIAKILPQRPNLEPKNFPLGYFFTAISRK